MRLRNIAGARERIYDGAFTVAEPEKHRGNWKAVFGNDNPVQIEIGMGKGRFIIDLAKKNPEINYIGIEKYSSVLLRAIQKMEVQKDQYRSCPESGEQLEEPVRNLRFIRMDAEQLQNVFAEREVDRIYLNFSDPWPKDRHARRRLPSREYLGRYNHILIPDGWIEFKTDNKDLFQFAVEELKPAGWKIREITYDLHKDEKMMVDNIMTEYEERFSSLGNPIYKYIIER